MTATDALKNLPIKPANITTATTTLVKTGGGLLHTIVINKPAANGTVTIYDGIDAGGTKMGTITMPATLLAEVDGELYDVGFLVGLCIVTTGTQDITVSYV